MALFILICKEEDETKEHFEYCSSLPDLTAGFAYGTTRTEI